MKETSTVRAQVHGPAAVLVLNRPEKANAYNEALLAELGAAFRDAAADPGIRAVLFTGAGEHFCSGADLDEMKGKTCEEALALRSQALFSEIARSPKPTIAVVNGAAVAGGLELALACDLRIAAANTRFAFPETSLGIIPAAGGTMRLPRIVGPALAKEMILAGRELSAEEALRAGLVGEVVEPDRLLERALQLAAAVARRDPMALRLAKQALDLPFENDAVLRYEGAAQALLYLRRKETPQPGNS